MMDDWYFGGMHWIWWGLWIILILWIFLIPYPTPGQKKRKDRAIEALRDLYALGEIDEEEFEKLKAVLLKDKK